MRMVQVIITISSSLFQTNLNGNVRIAFVKVIIKSLASTFSVPVVKSVFHVESLEAA